MHPARATTRQDDGELKARTRALLSPRKALTILRRREKCLHHFSVYEVAIELVELRQPELITLEVERGLGRIVRIAAQISEVLHQHKCPSGFPTGLAHDHALSDLLRVSQELAKPNGDRRAGNVSIGGLIGPIDEITSLLELNRKKERSRNINASDLAAIGIHAARLDLIYP